MSKTKIFAHRGFSSKFPDNTMPAFVAAVDLGVDGIEIDVQFTADKKIVISHDEILMDTTGVDGYIFSSTYEELTKLNFANATPDFPKTKIPLLSELLDLLTNTDVLLNIELKNSVVAYDGLEEAVIDMVKRYNMLDRIILSSFNHISMVKAKGICPEIQTALLYTGVLHGVVAYTKNCNADAIHPLFWTVKDDLLIDCLKNDIIVRPWTVDPPEYIKKMLTAGVDSIITNYPDVALELLE
ncbi:MAG: glycerophosphodiester phosphodiesterase [Clostridiales bacterium]|nr:glycerophosphodiester phosphodiesterase [Clostridiales bacterium]